MFQLSNVWFNRNDIKPDVPEHLETVDSMAKEISVLIEQEVANGTPLSRIILGLYTCLNYETVLGQLFSVS